MSRSYKKYPHARNRNSIKKRFRVSYNRHLRHTQPEMIDGGFYRRNKYAWSLPEYDYFEGYYSNRYYPIERLRKEHTSREKQLANGHDRYIGWVYSHLVTEDTLEELEFDWKKRRYFK